MENKSSEQLIATPLNSKGSQESNSLNIDSEVTPKFPRSLTR